PHVERFMRTLREEALDHFVFLSVGHLRRLVATYVRYYNGARPSQAIHGIPAPYPELTAPPPAAGTLLALPVLGGLHHDYRLAAYLACNPGLVGVDTTRAAAWRPTHS